MNKKIFFKTEPTEIYRKNIEILEKRYPNIAFPIGISEDAINEHLPDADGVVAGRFWQYELELAKSLRVLFIPFAGLDAFDIPIIASKGVVIANSNAASPFVAERALGLALSMLGKICWFDGELRRGYWHRDYFWQSLRDLRVGIWGVGHIGKEIAKLLCPFGCEITGLVRDITRDVEGFSNLLNNVDEFLESSDVVFIAIPLNKRNRNIIDEKVLMKMKGKYLVNISRGAVVDEEALYNALKNNTLSGAAIDCWYNYPRGRAEPIMPSTFPFHELDNIVVSPHACSHTNSARSANIEMTRKNIEAYINTGEPINIVKTTDS